MKRQAIAVGLTAVILAVTDEAPRVLAVCRRGPGSEGDDGILNALPSGPFDPARDRTLELGLWRWVEEQTGLDLRYVEQLYTFGNQYRDPRELGGGPRAVSVAYLALTHEAGVTPGGDARWQDWYSFLPWEDWRDGEPEVVARIIRPGLRRWLRQIDDRRARDKGRERAEQCFGADSYDRIRTLDRYELLYEAGLVPEVHRDRAALAIASNRDTPVPDPKTLEAARALGPAMALDDRRILASALGRIRGKLAYRPVVFELLPQAFTLLRLQRVVEALAGTRLHKQNFRRMLTSADLVESTGRTDSSGRGRPAELYRFRRAVMRERAAVGVGLPASAPE